MGRWLSGSYRWEGRQTHSSNRWRSTRLNHRRRRYLCQILLQQSLEWWTLYRRQHIWWRKTVHNCGNHISLLVKRNYRYSLFFPTEFLRSYSSESENNLLLVIFYYIPQHEWHHNTHPNGPFVNKIIELKRSAIMIWIVKILRCLCLFILNVFWMIHTKIMKKL